MVFQLETAGTGFFTITQLTGPQESLEFAQNSARVVSKGDNVGLVEVGSNGQLHLITPTLYSLWQNESATPYASKAALLADLTSRSFAAAGGGGGGPSFGAVDQVPVTNAGGTDFDYSSNLVFDGADLTVSPDTNASTVLGRARIHSSNNDIAMFSHFDRAGATDFAVYQGSAGNTIINSASGNALTLAIGISTKWQVNVFGDFVGSAGGDIQCAGKVKTSTTTGESAIGISGFTSDPSSLTNGDIWYNSTTNKFRARENGASVDMIGGGGGGVSFGTVDQIPVMNAGGTDFDYTANYTYEDNVRLIAKGEGSLSVAIGSSAEAQSTSVVSIGSSAGKATGTPGISAVSIGDFANGIGANTIGSWSVAIGSGARTYSENSISIGNGGIASAIGAMTFGRLSASSAQGAIMMGFHTSAQTNSLSDSFELSWDGARGFKTGNTFGTQVKVDADPATNLTDVENGCLAYDSTDNELQVYKNGVWVNITTA